jgi:hypothetical protein
MEATTKKARALLRYTFVLGAIATAVISTAACSRDASDDPKKEGENPGGGGEFKRIEAVANTPEAALPLDAVPSPDGSQVYFIAFSTKADEDGIRKERVPAIFKVAASGGGAPQKLHEGAPLSSPFGITISDDGSTLFLADSSAETSEDRADGKVFSMSATGGSPTALAGTEGMHPAGVEVRGDALYVTGKKDGKAGLFKTGLGGGNVSAVAVDGPFVDPGGVAIAKNGDAYVVDTGAVTKDQVLASVLKITPDGKTSIVVDGLAVGHPAGIALTNDDSTILVSGLDTTKGTDVVVKVSLRDRSVALFTDKIGDFQESAGLHRARNADVFAWADSHANKTGTVYVLAK